MSNYEVPQPILNSPFDMPHAMPPPSGAQDGLPDRLLDLWYTF